MSEQKYKDFLIPNEVGVVVRIKVVPNASRTKIVGILGDRLKVAVAAPPEAGKANKMLCQLLAKTFGIPKKHTSVTAGQTQPTKSILLEGVAVDMVAVTLEKLL